MGSYNKKLTSIFTSTLYYRIYLPLLRLCREDIAFREAFWAADNLPATGGYRVAATEEEPGVEGVQPLLHQLEAVLLALKMLAVCRLKPLPEEHEAVLSLLDEVREEQGKDGSVPFQQLLLAKDALPCREGDALV